MSDRQPATPRFNIIELDSQSADYQKYTTQFKFLEKLFWIIDNSIPELQQKIPNKTKLSLHKIIAIWHLLWLANQIRGIILLLNDCLLSQSVQLIRSLWEAKINLMYIAQLPKERTKAYIRQTSIELEKLLEQAKKRNSFVPADLTALISLPSPKKLNPKVWSERLKERAKAVRRGNEYRSIYRVFSWESHLSSAGMTKYIRRDNNDIVFDPTESSESMPELLIMASVLALKVLVNINQALNLWSGKQIKTIKKELVVLAHHEALTA